MGISGAMYRYFSRKYPYKKGEIYGSIFLPLVNYICLQPGKGNTVEQTGFAGIGGGLEYVYRNNRSIGLNFALRASFGQPLPGASPDKFGLEDTSYNYSAPIWPLAIIIN